MTQGNRSQESLGQVEREEMTLLEYALVFWRFRWLIATIFVVSVFAALIITILTPKVYESTTTLLAPKEGSGSGLLGGLAASALLQQGVIGINMPSLTPNRDMLVGVLRSRA